MKRKPEVIEVLSDSDDDDDRGAKKKKKPQVISVVDDDDEVEVVQVRRRPETIVISDDSEVITVDSSDDEKKRPAMRRGARVAVCLNDVDQGFTNLTPRDRTMILESLFEIDEKVDKWRRRAEGSQTLTFWGLLEEGAGDFQVKRRFRPPQGLPKELEHLQNGNVETASALSYCHRRLVALDEKAEFNERIDAIEPIDPVTAAKDQISFFGCAVCMDSFRVEDVVFCGGDAAHGLCRPCFRDLCNHCCTDKGVGSAGVECPVPECKSRFSRHDVLRSVPAIDVMQMDEREHDRSMRTAMGDAIELRCVCGAAGIIQQNDLGSKVIPCPRCHRQYCAKCGQAAHGDTPCATPKDKDADEKANAKTQAWIRNKTKQCPNCREAVEKNEGCNHVTCRCGHNWCFLCTGPFPNCHCGHFEDESRREAARLQRQEENLAAAHAFGGPGGHGFGGRFQPFPHGGFGGGGFGGGGGPGFPAFPPQPSRPPRRRGRR